MEIIIALILCIVFMCLIKNATIIDKKGTLKNNLLSAYNIKMSSQKVKFGDKEVDKKEFY